MMRGASPSLESLLSRAARLLSHTPLHTAAPPELGQMAAPARTRDSRTCDVSPPQWGRPVAHPTDARIHNA